MSRPIVLFLQATDPAIYPPLINAAWLLSEVGLQSTFLSSPHAENELAMPEIPGMTIEKMPTRPTFVVDRKSYLAYIRRAVALSRRLRPRAIYASDPMGALPGLIASHLSGAPLLYHEHDSPSDSRQLNPLVRRARSFAIRTANIVVFPNAARAEAARAEFGFDESRLIIVWNTPRIAEIPARAVRDGVFTLYYHGSINEQRLPMAVAEAVSQFGRQVRLQIAGYDTSPGRRHLSDMIERYGKWNEGGLIDALGQIGREDLLTGAATADAGLALMPFASDDINMVSMVGASNKAFDYMAAGLPIIVSDLAEWKAMYVAPGHGFAANPSDARSLAAVIRLLLDDPVDRRSMGSRNQAKIATEWNYDTHFRAVVNALKAMR
jgi:glycosyltransferase involved in cell wall biosynthesis